MIKTNEPFCFLDIETTGFSPVSSEIIEVYIETANGKIFDSLFRPRKPIPIAITELTGISDSMVANQPRLSEKIDEISSYLKNKIIVAHNARFDLSFLQISIARLNLEVFPIKYFCTLTAARKLFDLESYKLSKLAKALGFKDSILHRANSDCDALKFIFKKIEEELCYGKEDSEDYLVENGFIKEFDKYCNESEVPPLKQLTCEETLIEFVYEGGSNPGAKRKIHLNSIYEERGHVYLSGLCSNDNMEKSFRLDRIYKHITNLENKKSFKIPQRNQGNFSNKFFEKLGIKTDRNSIRETPNPKNESVSIHQDFNCSKCKSVVKVDLSFKSGCFFCENCKVTNRLIQIGKFSVQIEKGMPEIELRNFIDQLVKETHGAIDAQTLDLFFGSKEIMELIDSSGSNKIDVVERFELAANRFKQNNLQEKATVFPCSNCNRKLRLKTPILQGIYQCPNCKSEFRVFEMGEEIVVLPQTSKKDK